MNRAPAFETVVGTRVPRHGSAKQARYRSFEQTETCAIISAAYVLMKTANCLNVDDIAALVVVVVVFSLDRL